MHITTLQGTCKKVTRDTDFSSKKKTFLSQMEDPKNIFIDKVMYGALFFSIFGHVRLVI
jgi:hypothetical protein